MKSIPNGQKILFSALFSVLLTACGSINEVSQKVMADQSVCSHQSLYSYPANELPEPLLTVDTLLSNHFSTQALHIANAIGVINLTSELVRMNNHKDKTLEQRIRFIELSRAIDHRIETASLEISSVTSELNCEKERADQFSNYLDGIEAQRQRQLVVTSIIVGAAGSISSASLSLSHAKGNADTYIGLGVGVIGAALGVMMLTNNKKIYFRHERNTLGEVWEDPVVSKTLPPAIWYYLNYKDPKTKGISLRESLVEKWQTFGQVSKRQGGSERSDQLYFGQGARYSAAQLRNRADMYDQLEAFIALMKQDLKQLSLELEKVE